jgi:hypothetical protein
VIVPAGALDRSHAAHPADPLIAPDDPHAVHRPVRLIPEPVLAPSPDVTTGLAADSVRTGPVVRLAAYDARPHHRLRKNGSLLAPILGRVLSVRIWHTRPGLITLAKTAPYITLGPSIRK